MNASIVSNRYCAEHLGGHGYKIIDTVTGQSVTPEQVYTTATELAPGVFSLSSTNHALYKRADDHHLAGRCPP